MLRRLLAGKFYYIIILIVFIIGISTSFAISNSSKILKYIGYIEFTRLFHGIPYGGDQFNFLPNYKRVEIFKDQSEFKWCFKAANNGYPPAQLFLANCYLAQNYFGGGTIPFDFNLKEGIHWYKEAAANGNCWAMINLGYFYENGYKNGEAEVEINTNEAYKWYLKAADILVKENIKSDQIMIVEGWQHYINPGLPHIEQKLLIYDTLTRMNWIGIGTNRDIYESFKWYNKAKLTSRIIEDQKSTHLLNTVEYKWHKSIEKNIENTQEYQQYTLEGKNANNKN